jgi:hypothetical protein
VAITSWKKGVPVLLKKAGILFLCVVYNKYQNKEITRYGSNLHDRRWTSEIERRTDRAGVSATA